MPSTTWTAVPEVDPATEWAINTTPHRVGGSGGWGDAWGMFPWGAHKSYSDFTLVPAETLTTWTKL